ncbi:protein-disulfide reductase DsbD [Acidihalobacter prosperus]|uniref:Thiol:disulfide interchange protein DsbD n=1 Tax=Acidihalobacter prosperus TaxID=160660 RepID=A0A1A6C4Z4_9GAMM|nr:protein-disulfide reductase DsbD [Acidihalobacter prosperus]OBS09641.1 hypothetical protein Thpro_021969 [Acidihalobacter prosperus]
MMKRLLPILLALFLLPVAALAEQDAAGNVLPPEQAFPASATALSANSVAIRWETVPGHYLYRDKFSFKSETPGITLGTPRIPAGKTKHDETFGTVEVFTHPVTVRLPITRAAGAPDTLTLEATAQGCAEQSVCYPPFAQTLKIALPATQANAGSNGKNGLAALTANLNNEAQGQFLQPEQAFKFSLQTDADGDLVAHWDVAPGYHLYRDQIKFALEQGKGLSLGQFKLPPGKTVDDPILGKQVVYEHPFDVRLPITRAQGAADKGVLKVHYQGCADKGICYAPITKTVDFSLKPGGGGAAAGSTSAGAATAQSGTATNGSSSEQDRLAAFLLHKPLWMSLGLFFLLGLGLAFTPCIFPLFPILSGIIVGQRETPSPSRTFMLSLVYVLAMALTYTVAGVVVGLTGAGIQAWFQNPWVLSAFAAIFVLLSLSMFGFYDLQMPNFIQSRVTEISNRQQGGSLIGVGVMGFLSALIVGPCVTAPLVATLIVIANTGDALLGGLSLFALSMGMGLPLLIVCTACGRFLPKAGPWMDGIKGAFGVLMLGVAIWMLSRFLPGWSIALLTGLLLVASSVYLGAFDPVRTGVSGWHKLWKGLGIVLALWGVLILVGVAAGGGSVFTPLQGLSVGSASVGGGGQSAAENHGLAFKRVKSVADLDQALAAAKGKPVMLDFYADWCVSCKELEAYTFSNPKVQQALSGFVLLQADVTANNAADKALLKRFGLFGPPGIIFFNAQGREQRALQVVGYMPPGDFVKHVRKAADS